MKCPRCSSTKFEPFTHEQVEFDFCSDCSGIWADRGELSQYVETLSDLPGPLVPQDITKSKMACPKCDSQPLYEIPYMRKQNVLIDVCLGCQGLWMDAKELAQIQKLAVNIDTKGKLERTLGQMKAKGWVQS